MNPETDRGLREARRHRNALAGSLHYWVGRSVEPLFTDTPKHVLESAWLSEGEGAGAELLLGADARDVPWALDLEREATRLSVCESGAILLRDVSKGQWRAKTLGCNSRLCPVCGRTRAARACGRWRMVLEAAVADGCVCRHWTLTQPVDMAPGGLITAPEQRKGWTGTLAADGVVARAVGGEGLLEGYRRLRRFLTSVREGRGTRNRWRELGGVLMGLEWTGKDPDTGAPRWHVHCHMLTCTPPGVDIDEDSVISDWIAVTGGSRRANVVRIVTADRVVEVLKYPFKPAHLSSAQRIETLAAMRGMHPHQLGGAWSRLSRAYREDERWSRWLDARADPPKYLRLHYQEDGERRLWCGTPSQGRTLFCVLDGADPEHPWRHWYEDAAVYAAYLEDAHRGAPDLEPGSDTMEGWFE